MSRASKVKKGERMEQKRKRTIILCIVLFLLLLVIQWLSAFYFVLDTDQGPLATMRQMPIVALTTAGLTILLFVLFNNVRKEQKFLRVFLAYSGVVGIMATTAFFAYYIYLRIKL